MEDKKVVSIANKAKTNEEWVNMLTGLNDDWKAIAYHFLTRGFGEHTENLPEGIRKVIVKSFIDWNNPKHIDYEHNLAHAKKHWEGWKKQEGALRPDETPESYARGVVEHYKDRGAIDVVFIREGDCDDCGSFHYEFSIKCSGHGGSVCGPDGKGIPETEV